MSTNWVFPGLRPGSGGLVGRCRDAGCRVTEKRADAHEVAAVVDGVELGQATVTVMTLGKEFVCGASAHPFSSTVEAPTEIVDVVLEWRLTG